MVAFLLRMMENSTLKDIRERFKVPGFSDLLADGDMTALNDLVYSNLTEVYTYIRVALTRFLHLLPPPISHCSQKAVKERLIAYYAAMGMTDALRLILDSGFQPATSRVCSAPQYLSYVL